MRGEINEVKNRNSIEKISKAKSWFSKKVKKKSISLYPDELRKKKGDRIY